MKPEYERTDLIITEFDAEDVISTSGIVTPEPQRREIENSYRSFNSFGAPGPWF